ncbi:hypothetical protein F5Y09DRAFT_4151 [Xylaria sp. FL1042]|nr:hypothetical protein F5Y09DRAFT_4151 [Xylaria sp. FL1042]
MDVPQLPTSMMSDLMIPFKSQRVCLTCRKWKKQCDKTIPRCSRCVRKSLRCDYTVPTDNVALLHHTTIANVVLLRTNSCLPSLTEVAWNLLFDTVCNPQISHKEVKGLFILVQRILKATGTSPVDVAQTFRASIYPWFPILDTAAFIHRIESSKDEGTNDRSALLVLCMHIINQTPCQHESHVARNSFYLAARRLFFFFQDAGSRCPVELLQAGLLITLYECTHGLWTSAYLSLANCIALSHLAGLSYTDTFSHHGDNYGRACAWAIILLDRLMSLLNLDDPRPSLLPPDESRNDMGWLSRLNCSELIDEEHRNFPEHTKLYAASQTAHNLGDALRYISFSKRGSTVPLSFDSIDTSATSLIGKLLSKSQTHPLYLCDTTAFAVSVLVSLRSHDHFVRSQETHENLQTVMSLHSALNMAHDMVHTATKMTENSQIGDISFIGLASVLRAAIYIITVKGKSLDEKVWDEIEDLLLCFSKRWIIGVQLLNEFMRQKQKCWSLSS